MFGTNERVGKSNFRGLGKLQVTSMFLSLQGEGPFAGRPALFIRFAKCNLACKFCDTYFDGGDFMTVDEVIWHAMEKVIGYYETMGTERQRVGVVITGGEPTLQNSLAQLVDGLHEFAWVQIETNGAFAVPGLSPSAAIVISPKVVEDGDHREIGWLRPHADMLVRAACLKFVLSADPTSHYHVVPDWAHDWRRDTKRAVYVSPMNVYKTKPPLVALLERFEQPTLAQRNAAEVVSFWENDLLDMEQNRRNHEYAAQYALKHGLFLSLQMHLYAGIA